MIMSLSSSLREFPSLKSSMTVLSWTKFKIIHLSLLAFHPVFLTYLSLVGNCIFVSITWTFADLHPECLN
jgi:hypothetical protein